MPVGISDGGFFEDYTTMTAMSIPKDIKKVYITKDDPAVIDPSGWTSDRNVIDPSTMTRNQELDAAELDPTTGIGVDISFKMPLGASTEPADAFKSSGGSQVALEDRRDEPSPNAPEWKNVIPSIKDLLFKAFVGTPMAAEVPATKLGIEAGLEDAKIEKQVPSRSLLDKALDDTSDGAQFFYNIARAIQGKEPVRLGDDVPFSQKKFSEGVDLKSVFKTIDEGLISSGILSRETVESTPDVLTGFYEGIKNAFKLPGDVYAGKIDPMSPQGIERAFDLAGLAVLGPMPVAKKMADGTLGSFAGVKSKNLDKTKLYQAQTMELSGATADDIWETTGFMRGADNRWKYEISDREAYLTPVGVELTPTSKDRLAKGRDPKYPKGWDSVEDSLWYQVKPGVSLGSLLHHPELYKAYPELADIKIVPVGAMDMLSGTKGWFNTETKELALAPGKLQDIKSVALHELQHGIQKIEGFSTGASPELFKTNRWKALDTAFREFKQNVDKTVKEFFPDNPNKINDLKFAIKNESKLPQLEEAVAEGYTYPKKDITRIREGLELMDQVPHLRESIEKIVKGEKIVDDYHYLAWKEYSKVKGEVEARNVQERMEYTTSEREGTPAFRTEPIPRSEQIWSPWDPSSLKDLNQ